MLDSTVQLTSCDSEPCQNGGYCNSDPKTPDVYECQCGDWFKGTNCEGKWEGLFKLSQLHLASVSLLQEIDPKKEYDIKL